MRLSKRVAAICVVLVASVLAIMALSVAAGCSNGSGSGVTPKSSVNDYSWKELTAISEEIEAAGNSSGYLEVAKKYNLCNPNGTLDGTQVKEVTLTDGTKTQVQIVDFMHDDKTSGGKAGITFMFKDCIAERPMNYSSTSYGGWRDSDLRGWLNDVFAKELLPNDMQSQMVRVDKKTNNEGQARSTSCISVTNDLVWLPSAVELCSNITWGNGVNLFVDDIANGEGSGYMLYRDMGVKDEGSNPVLTKSLPNGTAMDWWLRTPRALEAGYFYRVDSSGNPHKQESSTWESSYLADNNYGVAPGFCI